MSTTATTFYRARPRFRRKRGFLSDKVKANVRNWGPLATALVRLDSIIKRIEPGKSGLNGLAVEQSDLVASLLQTVNKASPLNYDDAKTAVLSAFEEVTGKIRQSGGNRRSVEDAIEQIENLRTVVESERRNSIGHGL